MRSRTVTTVVSAARDEVFGFLADVRNLPEWADEFARELVLVDGRYRVRNGRGELFFELRADARTGTIDMLAGPNEQEMALFPARVVELPQGGTAFTFTMFQTPGLPDEVFEDQFASLRRELANVARRFGA